MKIPQQVLSLKLLIVMGISWIFEFVHFLIADHIYNLDCYLLWQVTSLTSLVHFLSRFIFVECLILHSLLESLQIVVGLFDFLNMHRGSLFFLIFVCKKSILSQVKTKDQKIN